MALVDFPGGERLYRWFGVELRFAGHGESTHADIVVAADGIGSTVRRLVVPQSKVLYQGLRTFLGRSKVPASAAYVGRTIESWGVDTRFVLTSLDGRTTYWSAIERPAAYEKNSAALAPDQVDRLRRAFAAHHPDIRDAIDHADAGSLQRCNFGVVTGLPRFYCGRVVFLGDSAHGMPPNMGEGASLALEDAYVLAAGLASGGGMAHVLAEYDRLRRPRARQMMHIANGMNGTFQPRGGLRSKIRDHFAAAFPDGLSQWRMSRLYHLPFSLAEATV